ncbi:MAG: nucleotidyltransferase [Myxococcales bacterium]|nr:nucleotidyltransferase [Myxococcales bacterium]
MEGALDSPDYEVAVAELLGSVLANANDRDAAAIQAHLGSIKQAIEKEVDGFVDLLFGGSVSKKTYVSGLSDVDALVVINESSLAAADPAQVVAYIVGRLRERLPNTVVEPDGFAITVRYADGVVQLVPVKRRGEDYLLPSADSSTWSRVRPRAFTDALTAVNQAQNGKVVPTVKLAKIALGGMPEDRRPSGYHVEALAVEVFSNYAGPTSPKAMVTHFFAEASKRVLTPIGDRTGQSRQVDEKLGASGSLERQILSDVLGRIGRRLQNADGAQDVEQWKRVLGVET